MAERVVIVVAPPESAHSSLTVEDAMQQVLDGFHLLISSSEADESITWRLVEAKTNSPPFSVVAEARSSRIGVDVDLIAKNQKRAFSDNYHSLLKGEIPSVWGSGAIRRTAENFVVRNRNGIALTEIKLDEDHSILLDQEKAAVAFGAFEKPISEVKAPREVKEPYAQIGSIEGKIEAVSTYRNQPAILVKERLNGHKVWCLVSKEYEHDVAEVANFEDVWAGRRVRVRGKLEYDKAGSLIKVHAVDVEQIPERTVPLEDIRDRNFTGSLTINEYIDKLREGEIDWPG